METFHSLGRHCYDNICHCDWRITLYECVESDAVWIINIITISLSGLVSALGLSILYQRVIVKGHSFMDRSSKKGLLRPKPIDSMVLLFTLFSLLRLINSIILVVDVAPNSMIFRSFSFEIGWQFGIWGCAAYVIGIAQASVDSQKSISNKWLPSPRVVDVAGFTFLIGPFVSNNSASIAAGALATSNIKAADILTQLLYVFWFIHCGSLATAIVYCGSRLTQILSSHLKQFNATGERYSNIKTGIFKIRSIVIILAITLYSFALFLLLFGILRDLIIKNNTANIFLCLIWNLLAPIAMFFIKITIISSRKTDKNSKNTTTHGSNTNQSTTVFESQNATNMDGGVNMTFQDTLTHTALDDLELKREESLIKQKYEQPFETAVYKSYHHDYTTNPTEMYNDDQESQYEEFELQRQNSKSQLINKTY